MTDTVVRYTGPHDIREISAKDFHEVGLESQGAIRADTTDYYLKGQVVVSTETAEWLIENEEFEVVPVDEIARKLRPKVEGLPFTDTGDGEGDNKDEASAKSPKGKPKK